MSVLRLCWRPEWAAVVLLIGGVPLLSSCGESQTSSGTGAQVGVAPAESMMEVEGTEDPAVVEAQADVIVSELKDLKIVTSASKSFVTRTLAQPTLELQAKAIPVLEAAISVDPKYKSAAREILKNQHNLALPEDKPFWEDEMRRLIG